MPLGSTMCMIKNNLRLRFAKKPGWLKMGDCHLFDWDTTYLKKIIHGGFVGIVQLQQNVRCAAPRNIFASRYGNSLMWVSKLTTSGAQKRAMKTNYGT